MQSPGVAELPRPGVEHIEVFETLLDASPVPPLRPVYLRGSDQEAVQVFEDLLRGAPSADDLQDRLASVVRWAEGRCIDKGLVARLTQQVRDVVLVYMNDFHPRTSIPYDELVREIQARVEGNRITFDLPAEVQQWLAPPSMTSY